MHHSPHDTLAPAAQADTAQQRVSIDFRRGIDRPKWEMVKATYAQDAPFLAVAPVFTAADTIPFSLRLEIEGAHFVGTAGEPPSFDLFSGNRFITPIEVGLLDTGRQTVDVAWTAPRLAKAWQRWVFRFFVTQSDGSPRPFPLAFVYLPPGSPEAQAARAARPGVGRANAAAAQTDNPGPTLSTIIQVVDGFPRYPDVFVYDHITLPHGIYPDPLINVLERQKPFRLDFISSMGTFSPTTPTACNRGGTGEFSRPLNLRFLGVSDPNTHCGSDLVPRGFQNSALARSSRQSLVDWNEPDGAKEGRVASFLFSDTEGKSAKSALLDPTVINDLPENPPG